MNVRPPPSTSPSAEYRYHLLRAASERFQTTPGALDAERLSQAERQAQQTFELESLVLSSPEARDTLAPEPRLDEAVLAIRQRYPDEDSFLADLTANGLDADTLRQSLRRELVFDAVMQQVGARAEPVSELDEQLFHELHRERFITPERRTARHILITVNDDFAENRREVALARIDAVAAQLKGQAQRFGALARQCSECPTATEDGRLGAVPRGQLYPELDAALFALAEGEVSGVLKSELGFHLLLCERIEPGVEIGFEQARAKIHSVIAARRRLDRQKSWLAELRQAT
ncbi:nitrogen fixation protein NifM [Thiocystis violascens]|uniref:peptidylprolyl isomerase n=1 Tax=Thiocystis violascens (strain ATCC 17096 / DSM 198 / 6111) TaxID=765911 RepID=I3YGI9_THIV6|nr:nitrogen fixation protein NifM [Thiocystis violascens]AFL76107.1 nitrogen fixation protein NifM [Thiocystis violascens DSM 198]